MNLPPKPKFTISVRYLGPVFLLDGELSDRRQNLIFARNGTGKSFISRGFRYLDLSCVGEDITAAAFNLVSDESPDGKGSLTISRGTTALGNLSLQKNGDVVTAETPERIFHIFSEDFVHKELREKCFNPDGNIENQIAVDSANIKLKEAQEAVAAAENTETEALTTLREAFETAKVSEVHEKAGVNKQLKDYKNLIFEEVLGQGVDKPDAPDRSFADILKDLDSLKSIPAEPVYPESVVSIHVNDIEFQAIKKSLQKITSPSTVSETIKHKIEAHRAFFETGTGLVTEHDADTCPYCEQGIREPPAVSTIEAYIAYFKDEEAQHKNELRRYYKALKNKETEITGLSPRIAHQRTRFDALKRYMPSQKDELLADCETEIEQACAVITCFKDAIEAKANTIDQAADRPSESLDELMQNLAKAVEGNNAKVAVLQSSLEKSDEERKSLQRRACAIFTVEFSRDHWGDVGDIAKLRAVLQEKREELAVQEKASPKKDAKERVAETFEHLLRQFFAEKYVFDRDSFVLKRGGSKMARGPHRTLSDGEKTAIAFCYFVACIHRKVESNGDYDRLFLVFDDPVTSMSYDFIFTIAQTLKNLSISKQGDISTNPSLIDGNTYARPELIILTHSSYFFNISITNRIVKKEAAFALHPDNAGHKLTQLNDYIAPFQQQLKDIYEVAENGREPDHQTGNAVRSVLEAVGRFCRPDKSDSLTNFITFLAGQDEFEIKSVMINSLSHGTYYEEIAPPDDLKLACKETIRVVEKFAVGQLEVIRSA
ncbi:MAG: AAA family ATPase [Alphaproteobacteria bacterium]